MNAASPRMVERIEQWPVERLIPYDRNARTHSEAQIGQIAASITQFGFNNPVLIDSSSGIIAGHGRYQAARKLGLASVPVIVLDHLTDAQRRAYIIADNKLALNAGWDEALLAAELGDLEADFDLSLLGFDEAELEGLLARKDDDGRADECPDVPETAVTQRGDLWVLGRHRVLCGDATDADDVARLMDGHKADMVFTDPPYGMYLDTNYDSMFAADERHRKTGQRFNGVTGDGDDFNPAFISTVFARFPSTSEIFLWGADYYADLITDRISGSWVVWDKRCSEEMDRVSGNTFELCWSKQKHKRLIARIQWSGHHGMQHDDTRMRVHPTQKPAALARWFFAQWGQHGDVVADLFLGSGSTLLACEQTNRACFGMELSEPYCDVIVKRWQDFTGRTATLDGDGRTFAAIAAERMPQEACR